MNFLKNVKGITMVEIVLSMGLFSAIMAYALKYYSDVSKINKMSEERAKKVTLISEYEKSISKVVNDIFYRRYNPEEVVLLNPDTYETFYMADSTLGADAKDFWVNNAAVVLPDDHFQKTDTQSIMLGSTPVWPNSHNFQWLRVNNGASIDSILDVKQRGFVFSRCIEMEEGSEVVYPTTLEQINALKRPMIKGQNKVECCLYDSGSKAATDCSKFNEGYLPLTIFFRTTGNTTYAPIMNDRKYTPGLGFVIAFNQNPPDAFILSIISTVNKCDGRRGGKCPYLYKGQYNQEEFDQYLDVNTKFIFGTTKSDISSSSFINIGN